MILYYIALYSVLLCYDTSYDTILYCIEFPDIDASVCMYVNMSVNVYLNINIHIHIIFYSSIV